MMRDAFFTITEIDQAVENAKQDGEPRHWTIQAPDTAETAAPTCVFGSESQVRFLATLWDRERKRRPVVHHIVREASEGTIPVDHDLRQDWDQIIENQRASAIDLEKIKKENSTDHLIFLMKRELGEAEADFMDHSEDMKGFLDMMGSPHFNIALSVIDPMDRDEEWKDDLEFLLCRAAETIKSDLKIFGKDCKPGDLVSHADMFCKMRKDEIRQWRLHHCNDEETKALKGRPSN